LYLVVGASEWNDYGQKYYREKVSCKGTKSCFEGEKIDKTLGIQNCQVLYKRQFLDLEV
jgi:hypothetical protein